MDCKPPRGGITIQDVKSSTSLIIYKSFWRNGLGIYKLPVTSGIDMVKGKSSSPHTEN
jgi:hypothetical protein